MTCYLDYAATAPLVPEAWAAMRAVLDGEAGNPSSLHAPGRRVRMALEEARERCAAALGVRVEEVVFTSGATEADNLALAGVMRLAPAGSGLVVSAVEHPAVRETAFALAGEGCRVDLAPVGREGRLDPSDLVGLLTSDTRLVSVMAVNNEVGVEQPVPEVAEACARRGVLFHCDAVQAAGHRRLRPAEDGIDLLSLSAHKIGGPAGAGLLYVRRGLTMAPLLRGGGQEDGRRPGTENVAAVAGLAAALERAVRTGGGEALRLRTLQARLEAGLARLPGARRLGEGAPRAPHISSWLFEGLPAESILVALDMEGVAASSGSACSSHSVEPSEVLRAMGLGEEEARGLVRFSMGWGTRDQDVDRVVSVMSDLVLRLRGSALEVAP